MLCELSCDTKEETMDSTDSALDETLSFFWNEVLSVYTRFWGSVGFFHLITQFKLAGASLRNSRFHLYEVVSDLSYVLN